MIHRLVPVAAIYIILYRALARYRYLDTEHRYTDTQIQISRYRALSSLQSVDQGTKMDKLLLLLIITMTKEGVV